MVVPCYSDSVLVFDKQEILAEAEDELLDVVNNFLFNYGFVHFFDVAGTKFLNIDEIKHVLVFEGKDGTLGKVARRQFLHEIVRQTATLRIEVLLDAVFDAIWSQMLAGAEGNVKEAF